MIPPAISGITSPIIMLSAPATKFRCCSATNKVTPTMTNNKLFFKLLSGFCSISHPFLSAQRANQVPCSARAVRPRYFNVLISASFRRRGM